jgi:hypothetical protein
MSSNRKSSAPAHHPEVVSGDPFAYAGRSSAECPACYEGWVYLGFEAEEGGELVEITDRVRCRRCNGEPS